MGTSYERKATYIIISPGLSSCSNAPHRNSEELPIRTMRASRLWRATNASASVNFKGISKLDENNAKTVLCTDGAQCYAKLARELKVQHLQCNHSQNQFVLQGEVVHSVCTRAPSITPGVCWSRLFPSLWLRRKATLITRLWSSIAGPGIGDGRTLAPACFKRLPKSCMRLPSLDDKCSASLAIEKMARRSVLKPEKLKKHII